MPSSEEELKRRLLETIDHCLAMQEEHVGGLQAGNLSEISQWTEERQGMVARLQQALTGVQSTGLDAELRELLIEKLGRILETEKELFAIAEQHRRVLAGKITSLRRGKRALNRYGSGHNLPPRFISDNG